MPEIKDTVTFTFVDEDGSEVAGHRHRNPDGSVGGWVAANAEVASDAFIEKGAVVGPKARVASGRRVPMGTTILLGTTLQ